MTLPSSDAQPSRLLPRKPQFIPSLPSFSPAHSIAEAPSIQPSFSLPMTPNPTSTAPNESSASFSDKAAHEHAIDFATHSLDLATGGLKTLTAKREFPMRIDRRTTGAMTQDIFPMTRSYAYVLAILVCVVLILIGGGVVLFVMLQP